MQSIKIIISRKMLKLWRQDAIYRCNFEGRRILLKSWIAGSYEGSGVSAGSEGTDVSEGVVVSVGSNMEHGNVLVGFFGPTKSQSLTSQPLIAQSTLSPLSNTTLIYYRNIIKILINKYSCLILSPLHPSVPGWVMLTENSASGSNVASEQSPMSESLNVWVSPFFRLFMPDVLHEDPCKTSINSYTHQAWRLFREKKG